MTVGKGGRPPLLSRDIILDAAFRIVDADPSNDLTMKGLGRELNVDPSAVYRLFRDRDDLLIAMADVMLAEVRDSYAEGATPLDNLRRMAWTMRRSYLRRPGLARFVYFRFTGGDAEVGFAQAILANMRALGYDEEDAVLRVRALVEMTLSHIGMTSDSVMQIRLVQPPRFDRLATLYSIESTPGRTDAELREAHLADADRVFEVMLECFLAAVWVQAPG
jgi:AcrR family transcriptional regulator